MDNERPIEKLLRDYAKKRRTDAGEPLKMHPATRRLLQGEVARQFPKAKRGGSSLVEFFARWRPGLVYATCVLVVITISVPLLLPIFRNADSESQLAKVRSEGEAADLRPDAPTLAAPSVREADEKRFAERSNESGEAALAFADTERAKDDTSGLKLEEEKQKSQPARKLTTDTPAPSAPAIAPPAPQIASRDRATFDAQSRLEQSTRETRADDAGKLALQSRPTVADAPAAVAGEKLGAARAAQPPKPTDSSAGVAIAARSPGATPTPSAAAPVLTDSKEAEAFSSRYGLARNAAVAVVQKFTQTQATASYRRSADADATSPVLGTFQLEQAGDQLRVIDSDGSTYTGAITLPAADAYGGTKVELKGGPVKPGERMAAQPVSTATEFNYQAGQNYFFRVTGTNRTLRQPVVFAGNILILTNAPVGQTALTQVPTARSQSQIAPAQNQLPGLLNSTISGKVQLGTNKEMQLNAVPVNP